MTMPAVKIPNKNPEQHAAVKSNATVLVVVVYPTAEAMEGASPNKLSGEEVAQQMMRWILEGEILDISIAFWVAVVGFEGSRFM
jgi:hypothetical protein